MSLHMDIRQANDLFRTTMGQHPLFTCPGQILITPYVSELGPLSQGLLLCYVRDFTAWAPDSSEEHDFGAIELKGERFFFKIDYYDPDMEHGAEDPTDLGGTVRVLTIMHASEY